MQIEKLDIEGLLIIHPAVFEDDRGYFYESYSEEKYKVIGEFTFVQDNLSKSSKGVLRGLHFQNPPYAQGKLVSVLRGSVLDVVVDIKKNSPTFGKHYLIQLSEQNKIQFFIPPGFAHGFKTLEDNTIFSYKCTNGYNKQSEGSIRWNDKELGINWDIESPIVSEKDHLAPLFSELKSQF
ncbi:MAG: dTDP-4-dehydrorhamnose 3,5-epimerase [Flavobacteriales bacterium]|nr:dTDP-4-dehydrorhamnose 3,5-epimerase [Flavobacteriales bacterium]